MQRERVRRHSRTRSVGAVRQRAAVPWLRLACWFYLVGVFAAWALLYFFSDKWWVATVFSFGPRWLVAVPLIWFVPLAALFDRRAILLLLVAGTLVAWPIMGLNVSFNRIAANTHPDLRLLTYNIGTDTGGASTSLEDLWRLVRIVKPDVVALQECDFVTTELIPMFPGYNVNSEAGGCLLSRFPIVAVDKRDRKDVRSIKGSGAIDRFEVATPRGVVSILNLQLSTVRNSLQSVVDRSSTAVRQMRDSIIERSAESLLARDWAQHSKVPLLIAGDFNIPADSQIFQRFWSDFGDAYSKCGSGYGYTKFTKWFGIRIDHVLFDQRWECLDASVDSSMRQGDHRPLIADFKLR